MACMVTHPNFILAVLEEVLKARPQRVILGMRRSRHATGTRS